jgi:tRNA nucleotidyltransferase (CCA-adding enzyme)
MQTMVQAGEVDALVPERVWQELSRGLMEKKPSRLFQVLQESGALQKILPELAALEKYIHTDVSQLEKNAFVRAMQVVDFAAEKNTSLAIRVAALLCDTEKVHEHELHASVLTPLNTKLVETLCARLKMQNEVRDLAIMLAREWSNLRHAEILSAELLVKLFERCDALRRPDRFDELLMAMECHQLIPAESQNLKLQQTTILRSALAAVQSVAAGTIAATVATQVEGNAAVHIAEAIHKARIAAVEQILNQIHSS